MEKDDYMFLKGGTWLADPDFCKVRNYSIHDMDKAERGIGFRVYMTPIQENNETV